MPVGRSNPRVASVPPSAIAAASSGKDGYDRPQQDDHRQEDDEQEAKRDGRSGQPASLTGPGHRPFVEWQQRDRDEDRPEQRRQKWTERQSAKQEDEDDHGDRQRLIHDDAYAGLFHASLRDPRRDAVRGRRRIIEVGKDRASAREPRAVPAREAARRQD